MASHHSSSIVSRQLSPWEREEVVMVNVGGVKGILNTARATRSSQYVILFRKQQAQCKVDTIAVKREEEGCVGL